MDAGEANEAIENKFYRRMLGISYKEHKTNELRENRSISSPDVRSCYSRFYPVLKLCTSDLSIVVVDCFTKCITLPIVSTIYCP